MWPTGAAYDTRGRGHPCHKHGLFFHFFFNAHIRNIAVHRKICIGSIKRSASRNRKFVSVHIFPPNDDEMVHILFHYDYYVVMIIIYLFNFIIFNLIKKSSICIFPKRVAIEKGHAQNSHRRSMQNNVQILLWHPFKFHFKSYWSHYLCFCFVLFLLLLYYFLTLALFIICCILLRILC